MREKSIPNTQMHMKKTNKTKNKIKMTSKYNFKECPASERGHACGSERSMYPWSALKAFHQSDI